MSLAQENYDEALAKKLGADEFEMKKYVIAFLYRGDRVSEYSEVKRSEIQKDHMANITKLAGEGKMVLAGSFFWKLRKERFILFLRGKSWRGQKS